MATKEQMCDFEREFGNKLQYVGEDQKKAPNHIRCPKCGRRLKPRLYNIHHNSIFSGDEEWRWRVPPHKVKRWWKKKKPLSTKKRER
jgi:hypothetical protein